MLNLLDNAIKYAPPGGSVHVSLRREHDRYRLAVAGTGEPIPDELRERIFERFFRSETARAADAAGAGLGLSIARWVAELKREAAGGAHRATAARDASRGHGTAAQPSS